MKKTWRTLIRIVSINEDTIEIIIPGCGYDNTFLVSKSSIPFPVECEINYKFYGKANLDAESSDELMLSDFEFPPQELIDITNL